MSIYDKYFDFRMASDEDIDAIMKFIRENWDENHILGNDKEFFKYFYSLPNGEFVNMFLMLLKDGTIAGINGFVRYSDEAFPKYISSAMTKVLPKLPVPMCGIELMKRFYTALGGAMEFSSGSNEKTIVPIHEKIFGCTTGVMQQYCFLNEKADKEIISVNKNILPELQINTGAEEVVQYSLKPCNSVKDIEIDLSIKYESLPFKDEVYFARRYFQHPIFHYDIYSVIDTDERALGLLVTRDVDYEGSRITFIADYYGRLEAIEHLKEAFQMLCEEKHTECLSLFEFNMQEQLLVNAGFRKVTSGDDSFIVPTYFQPFWRGNIESHCVTKQADLVFFKATGDQDNPKYL